MVSDTVSPENAGHLVEDAAKRPDVGALVDRLPARLFGTHVRGRPQAVHEAKDWHPAFVDVIRNG
jgi:hypothetical protein